VQTTTLVVVMIISNVAFPWLQWYYYHNEIRCPL